MDKEKAKKTAIRICAFIIILLLLAIAFLLGKGFSKNEAVNADIEDQDTPLTVFTEAKSPCVMIETPDKREPGDREEFSVALKVNTLGDGVFPAASFSISFDPSRLEFTGIDEGNVMVTEPTLSSGFNLPDWSVDTEHCNATGEINLMYLDMTGGDRAFVKDSISPGDSVILYLKFKLRGSARSKDIYEIAFKDACFAASDERESLSMINNTLSTINGMIVVGE